MEKIHKPFKYLEVISFEGGVVKRLDVTNESDRNIDRIEIGVNINLNHELFYTSLYDGDEKREVI